MDYFSLYLILRLDVVSKASLIFVIITGIIFALALLISAINYNDEDAKNSAKPWVINFGISFVIALLFTVAVPSTKQAAVVYCLPKVVNNEQVQKMPDNLLKLANRWINEQINETTEAVTETTAEVVEN